MIVSTAAIDIEPFRPLCIIWPHVLIHHVFATKSQVLDGEASPEEISYRLYDLLSVTKFENGRERTQRSSRTKPKKSTKWVDWY